MMHRNLYSVTVFHLLIEAESYINTYNVVASNIALCNSCKIMLTHYAFITSRVTTSLFLSLKLTHPYTLHLSYCSESIQVHNRIDSTSDY